ncbi:peroxisomal membrane protein 2 [Osmia lignaria lignaria]|uniref:peroxisomal membrane protein 2 n=1 Tax=Osmia lignaria lignaria TaxID=1437193 RepID=UPI0014796B0D|nr:peroxisomal membrane protein 2 [Osmia lignaria]
MALSKPTNFILHLTSAYFERLYNSPLKTKAITSCIIATLGNFISQKISGVKRLNQDSLLAFALFGLLFGGPAPHYFYTFMQPLLKNPLILLLVERLLYTPCYQALALYMIALFEGNTYEDSYKQLKKLYLPVLTANLKYITLLQYLNLKYVPPLLRVLVVNLIGFFWAIYLAQQRSKQSTGK